MKKALDAREFRLAGRLALITQSLRDITDKKRDDKPKKRLHNETIEKDKKDKVEDKEKKRDKKRKFKDELKGLMAEDDDKKGKSEVKEETKVESNNDFKNLLGF